MAENVVGIDIVARLDAFKAEMAKLGPEAATAGKQIAAELSKGIKQNTAALNQQRTAAAAAAKSTAALGGAASKAAKAFGPLGGILARLSPEAGAVSSSIASATTALEGLGVAGPVGVAAIAAVTAAAALGYTTYRVYTEESDRAAETAAMVAKAHKELAPFMDTARDATIALRVATGELTEEEGRLETAALKAWRAVNAATAGAKEDIAGLQAKQTSALRQGLDMFDGTFGWTPLGQAVDAFTTSASEAGEQQRALTGALNTSVVATKSVVEADRAAIKAGADRTAGLKDTAAAIKARVKEEKRLADAIEAVADAEAQRIEEQSPTSLKNQREEFSAALKASKKADEEELKAAKEFDERMAEIEDDATERALRNEKRREAGSIAAQASMADFALTAQDAIAKAAEHGTEAQKQQLRAVWKVTQGVRAAEAIINGAGAFARALADYPYPYSLIVGGLAAGTAAIQVATIMGTEPSFHAGTSDARGRPDEFTARLQTGEAVASRQGAEILGRENIDRANAGRSPAPATIRVTNQYRHKEYNAMMRDNLRAGGPVRDAINTGTVTGHRAARR